MSPEEVAALFNLILSFGCSASILMATWPFQRLTTSWLFTNYKYTWTTHVMMTWFDVGCIGLFTANLYCLLVYPDIPQLDFRVWKGNFLVNCVMYGLWGAHNSHQWSIIMVGTDKGTEGEWRRPYPMFGFSLLGACGTGFVRNAIHIYSGKVDPTVNYATGGYEILCLVIVLVDLGYFLATEHTWGMNKADDFGKESARALVE
mmetsp:Transcript_93340/g.247807  ORF Transcript_93340/g.247807 Transcript_93340/m.247807 type:complete len:203 (-) Transcript_93340:127-735(-)